jgi:hypothetical protein
VVINIDGWVHNTRNDILITWSRTIKSIKYPYSFQVIDNCACYKLLVPKKKKKLWDGEEKTLIHLTFFIKCFFVIRLGGALLYGNWNLIENYRNCSLALGTQFNFDPINETKRMNMRISSSHLLFTTHSHVVCDMSFYLMWRLMAKYAQYLCWGWIRCPFEQFGNHSIEKSQTIIRLPNPK